MPGGVLPNPGRAARHRRCRSYLRQVIIASVARQIDRWPPPPGRRPKRGLVWDPSRDVNPTGLPCPKCGKKLRENNDCERQRLTLMCRPKCGYRKVLRRPNPLAPIPGFPGQGS
jgi:hypothetical protein